ncbi:ComF family protein [Spirosoma sp. KNUC1025]|uniref:ComF family protein n=1 Tax=Spirosoma sp. KNUC1025 TaxID=2894082 RepID=UPI0038658651|nr:ComF family protein [Spirosoma sp. KNUC1025]
MFKGIGKIIVDFIDSLFPTLCIGCDKPLGENEQVLCTNCRIQLPETGQHRSPHDERLMNKFAGKVPIQFIASYVYFTKGSIVQKIIHNIKYKGHKEAAKVMAGWYAYQLKHECDLTDQIDVIIGVPLHVSRLKQRGYNQAEWIAEGLGEVLNVPVRTDVLVRNRFEISQTYKNRLERWDNVKSVFTVYNQEAIAGKNVVLVDDVLTTGATLEACAIELLKSDCKSVSLITLATASKF